LIGRRFYLTFGCNVFAGLTGDEGDEMTFEVEVLLKGTDEVITETVTYDGGDPSGWTDTDVREVLMTILKVFDRANLEDGAGDRDVNLRGLSWIVTDTSAGVAIAIEIPSGAIAAGPFDIPEAELTLMIERVMVNGDQATTVH
jgi:hypothetical protein